MKLEFLEKSQKLSQLHPCLGGEANVKYGRVHLPVSPSCNIQCRFCKRAFNKTDNRPGVTGCILKPEEVLETVEKALVLCPDITVVGIAGPGDSLATDDAVKAFSLIHKKYPDLIKCLSTNGLLLAEKASELEAAGVSTITVTVNAVDPSILSNIISHIEYEGIYYTGEAAAVILIDKQLEGIRKASEFAVVKVNTVLIPGVNDSHIAEIAKAVKQAGANIYNIIPLIPQHEFENTPAPDCQSLDKARQAAGQYIEVFRHCRHCRADACGIPGKNDFSSQLFKNQTETFSHG